MSASELSFRVSTFCSTGGCVGVATGRPRVAVTSTVEADGPVLFFDTDRWTTFVEAVRDAPRL